LSFELDIAAPYSHFVLVTDGSGNLQTPGSAISANPAAFAQQVAANQMGHAQTFATGLGSAVQSLPAQLANLPANIRLGLQGLLSVNSGALPQQFANNQTGTPISGILPGLLYYLPANPAAAIGGPPAPVIPPGPS
jgi:hypothetical protein